MTHEFIQKGFHFNDPRLRMTSAGRFVVRVVTHSFYGILIAGSVILSLSDVSWIQYSGLLLVLFLIDRVVRIGKSERSLARIKSDVAVTINVSKYLTSQTYRILETALGRAQATKESVALNVLQFLVERRDVRAALARMDIPYRDFEERLKSYIQKSTEREVVTDAYAEIELLAVSAVRHALVNHSVAAEPKDLFGALMQLRDPQVMRLMNTFSVEEGDLENALIFSRLQRRMARIGGATLHLSHFISAPFKRRSRIMNRAWTARPTPTLDRFSTDFTAAARSASIGFLVGHEKEYDRILDILSKPGNNNALLIGEPGAGKETIIQRLAFQIAKDRVPPVLFDKRIVSLSLGSLSAGAGEGEVQERVTKLVDEIVAAGNVMLYIPEIHNLVKTGGPMQLTAADVLIPALKGTSFSVIGTTYPREFKQHIDQNSDFKAAFESVRIEEISEDDAVRFLMHEALLLERKTGIVTSFKAVKRAVVLAHKYFRETLLPSSADNLLKEALSRAAQEKKKVITPEEIIRVAEQKINIPLKDAEGEEAKKLLVLESLIHQSLIDQDEAVRAVSGAMREYRSGLSRKGGPIATFLFVGPTGVGKTELAKILTRLQFGNESLMARFDMSEYQDTGSFMRLIGAPDGSTTGTLTDSVLEKPYSLVLLDEFEKAHPDILNLFLQVFDDGRLTDSIGRTVDFSNTVIIATSNAHSEFVKSEIEKEIPIAEIADQLKRKLTDYFKPELLNRFSRLIVFKNLSPEDIAAIARLRLGDLSALLEERHGIVLEFDDTAVARVAELGYDPVFGARPLRKVISEKLRSVLAEKLLKDELTRGATVRVTAVDGEFVFTPADS